MSTSSSTTEPTRAWEQLLERLGKAENDQEFRAGMLQLQCQIVAAQYGALWIPGPKNQPKLATAWPDQLTQSPEDGPVMKMLASAAVSGAQRKTNHVLKLKAEGVETPEGMGDHVFVTVLKSNGNVAAVVTVVADLQDNQVILATDPMRALAAGLYELYEARRNAETFEADANRTRRAMALLAVSQDGRGFNGACLNAVNELTHEYGGTRVSLGWVRGRAIKLVTMSDTEDLKRHSEQAVRLETAMAECLDQQQPVVYPLPEDAEPLLAEAVVFAHRELNGKLPGHHTLSVPLRQGEDLVGVITFEKHDPQGTGFDTELIRQIQLIADVLGPHLADRKEGDRLLPVHAWHSVEWAASYLVGPKHVAWKIAGLAVTTLVLIAVFGTWPYKVTAEFVLEDWSKRIVPAPFEARLDELHAEPGLRVTAGQTLAILDSTDMRLQLFEAKSTLKIRNLERTRAMAEQELADAQQALATMEQVQARINLLEYRIGRATIRSPIDGVVLQGDWHDRVGGVVKQGDAMFEIAPVQELVALARVDESDISLIDQDNLPTGSLATRSVPSQGFGLQVLHMLPAAEPVEGANVFELRCRVEDPAPWLRPGMQGLAKVEVGDKRIIWIATRRIVDTLRLWLWF